MKRDRFEKLTLGKARRKRYPRPGIDTTYDGAHSEVRRTRGAPTEYTCADCDQQACDWSYDNADPDQFTDRKTGCAYSDDPSHYLPRCRSCHRKADHAHRNPILIPWDPEGALELYRRGWSIRWVALSYDRPQAFVRQFLVDNGEPLRPARPVRPTDQGKDPGC